MPQMHAHDVTTKYVSYSDFDCVMQQHKMRSSAPPCALYDSIRPVTPIQFPVHPDSELLTRELKVPLTATKNNYFVSHKLMNHCWHLMRVGQVLMKSHLSRFLWL